jgi:hypothetical protein
MWKETDKMKKETQIWKETDKMSKERENVERNKQNVVRKRQNIERNRQNKLQSFSNCKAIQVYSKWQELSEGGKDCRRLQGLKWWILFCSPHIHYSQQQIFLSTLRPCVNESRSNGRCGQCCSVVENVHN